MYKPISLFLFGAFACLSTSPAETFDPQRYLGHLTLESSTLVLTEAVSNVEVPWDLEFSSDGYLWFTQHSGSVGRYDPNTGEVLTALESIPDLYNKKSLGLFGMALHPKFEESPQVFLHYAYQLIGNDYSETIRTRLIRYTFDGTKLRNPKTIIDAIPGKAYHNGSRILISEDLKLYLTIGDAGDTLGSQDPAKLTGKVLRANLDGSIPDDNPYDGSYVWSYGHRNQQGLALSPTGLLYASEHGPNNDDEINLIKPQRNYGWPIAEGYIDTDREKETSEGLDIAEPLIAWTPTIAASGLAFYSSNAIPEWKQTLLLTALKGQALRVLALSSDGLKVENEHIFFQKRFGRLRDVTIAPNGDIYICTSNQDWHPRYQPWMYDGLPEGKDRIIRIHKANTDLLRIIENLEHPIPILEDPEPLPLMSENWTFPVTDEELEQGQSLYMTHCVACHNPSGTGAEDLYPPLAGSDWVTGDKARLIQIVLKGLSGPIEVNGNRYDQEMPSFANLADQDIAAILSYIRKSFGNDATGVIAAEVYEERKGIEK